MHCDEARRLLTDLLYGELDPETAAAVARHLDACPGCAERRRALERTVAALDAWSPVEPSGDARAVARAAVVAAAGRRRWRRPVPWAAGLAAGLLLAVGVLLLSAEIRVGDGGVIIAFGRPAPAPSAEPAPAPATAPPVARVVRDEVGRSQELMLAALEGHLQEWAAEQDRRYEALVAALGRTHAAGRADTRRTRAMLDDVVRIVAAELGPTRITPPERTP
ncbi:MAG: anti-sigma factor family protein [Planctomycetota bacterium]|jgi:anti-sigma factor RsiW